MQKITDQDAATISRFHGGASAASQRTGSAPYSAGFRVCAARLTKNPDEAADAVAETLVRGVTIDRQHAFRGPARAHLRLGLYRIETNCFLDMRKKARSRPCDSLDEMSQSSEGQLEIQIADDRPSAQQHVEKGERMSTITAAMERLPIHQRAILMMYHAESMSYEDISETLRLLDRHS